MTADSAIPNPPTDKGAIDQALAELDAAVADWAAAMTEDSNVSLTAVRDLIASRREALANYRSDLGQHQVRLNRGSDDFDRREIELNHKSAALERKCTETERCAAVKERRLAEERDLLSRREVELSRREALIAERESGFTSADDDVQEQPTRSKAACDESDAAIPGAHVEVRQCEHLDLYESIDRAAKAADGLVPYVAHRNQKREWLVVVRADDLPRLADCVVLMSGPANADAGPNQRRDHYQPPTPCAESQNLRDSTT